MLKEKNCALILGNKGLIDNKKKKIKKILKRRKNSFRKQLCLYLLIFFFDFLFDILSIPFLKIFLICCQSMCIGCKYRKIYIFKKKNSNYYYYYSIISDNDDNTINNSIAA